MKCSNAFSRCICIKEELLAASVCPLWVSLWCLPLGSTLSNCTKLPDVGYPISMANDMMFCNERHPLVMKCSNAFLRYKRQVGGPSDSICKALVGLIVPCSTEVDSQIASKLLDVGYPLIVWKIWWCTARRDNHCLWSVIALFRCIRQLAGASDNICRAHMGLTLSFSTTANSHIAHKLPDLASPSEYWKMHDVLILVAYEVFHHLC